MLCKAVWLGDLGRTGEVTVLGGDWKLGTGNEEARDAEGEVTESPELVLPGKCICRSILGVGCLLAASIASNTCSAVGKVNFISPIFFLPPCQKVHPFVSPATEVEGPLLAGLEGGMTRDMGRDRDETPSALRGVGIVSGVGRGSSSEVLGSSVAAGAATGGDGEADRATGTFADAESGTAVAEENGAAAGVTIVTGVALAAFGVGAETCAAA